ncbi:hypothetical protein CAPTEDRAFT_209363 [Capitella teleta]|uniref:Uncharacterized protein n=1 Tax=Capitella teleta TaxID=283909 RepID=R7TME2_CAPTE|nr:hypothetical protein CAPTEDRAFT_209363 [Capitella teleta]|eukprot:ELT94702.1 hypothetical protein CAPTEDRAFT_209363 [Capitella teleta]
MKTLKSGSGAGWDDVKPSALKEVADLIVVPLTDLINLSLQQGVVPVELKIARVVPIYKAGEKQELVNYRPVSVLPSVSKVYERVVIWAADSATSTTVLHRLQKRVVRVIHKLHPRESTGAYFRLAGIMTISEINRIETAIFAYKWKFSLLPTLFGRFFSLRSDTHSRQTRSAQTFNLIKCRTETRKRSLAFRAAALLNRIYELNVITFSTIMSVKLFKRTMRNAVIDGMF